MPSGLDVGCGGGLLLRDAIARGAAAIGLDHSEDMVSLARERAGEAAVALGRAESLPFQAQDFTAVSMSIVLIYLPDPLTALREAHRVLTPGGRLAVYTTGVELRGTRAAPEPLASRALFRDRPQTHRGGHPSTSAMSRPTASDRRQVGRSRWVGGSVGRLRVVQARDQPEPGPRRSQSARSGAIRDQNSSMRARPWPGQSQTR